MNLDKTVSFPAHIMFQPFDDEGVLLDIRTQEHFGLDSVSTLFLKHLQNGSNTDVSIQLILDEYDVEEERLTSDLNALLDTLLEHGLIEVS